MDLHIHSKYSRACSKQLELPQIARACERKGIDVVVTGDFTHPQWFSDIKSQLKQEGEGVFVLADGSSPTKFILGTELSCIYKDKDKVRRLHLLVFAPSIDAVEKLNKALEERGCNLKSDGRPILGLKAKELLQMCLDIDDRFEMIPAHAWTPWFAIFGSKSGYDSLEECFEELTPRIRAIETGLSSDVLMNRRLSALDGIALVSNSDAHSLRKLGREANVLELEEVTYDGIFNTIASGDPKRFLNTIEFYPEEGKYHHDGHRDCNISFTPEQSAKAGDRCPKCARPLTIGVLNRVVELADRSVEQVDMSRFVPEKKIVPLEEIISDVVSVGVASKRVQGMYDQMIESIGDEFYILLDADEQEIAAGSDESIAKAVMRVRTGDIHVEPGYDGVFGTVKVFSPDEKKSNTQQSLL